MSERYRQEIEDLLEQIEELPPQERSSKKPSLRRAMFALIGRFLGGKGWNLSPGRIMVASIALLLVALLIKGNLPGIAGPVLAWGAVALFILGYALFFINPSQTYETRWRGQTIEKPPSLWERIRRRVKSQ
ncbi:MAG: hypothetical protein IIB33_01160 [Chloroflexi bacterium]|nr:hypothetical protein [Chloroflexota bacterium]